MANPSLRRLACTIIILMALAPAPLGQSQSHAHAPAAASAPRPGSDKVRVLALVPTKFADAATRDAIRTTWVERTKPGWELDLEVAVETLFVIGQDVPVDLDYIRDPMLRKTPDCLRKKAFDFGPYEEMERHKDMLMLPVLDSALTVKSLAMFEWAYHNRPDADYVIKVDADTYVHWPRFQSLFPRTDAKVVVGRRHPDKKMLGTDKVGGEVYGVSRATLKALMQRVQSTYFTMQAALTAQLHQWIKEHPNDRRLSFSVPERHFPAYLETQSWTAQLTYIEEDLAISMLLRLVDPEFKTWRDKTFHKMWAHGDGLKTVEAYKKCHETGHCQGAHKVLLEFTPEHRRQPRV